LRRVLRIVVRVLGHDFPPNLLAPVRVRRQLVALQNSRNPHSVGADLSGNFMQDEHAQRIIQIVLDGQKHCRQYVQWL
jgi:hypothetical protein